MSDRERDERRLTVIVVPHGDLETRTYEIPYRKLKLAIAGAVVAVALMGIVVAAWFPVLSQASRVPALVRELEELEVERAHVVQLAQTLAEVEAQYERVRQMLGADGASGDDSLMALPPLRSPGDDAAIEPGAGDAELLDWPLPVAGFITRSREESARQGEHPGLDIAVPAETEIRASGEGVVKEARQDRVYGHYVLVDHGEGLESLYGHASRVLVREGDRVSRGQLIALAGSTGLSSAPHLHFEIRKNGRTVDPLQYVRQP
ncbi:MAG TPA: M23 family metallopeptidase [Longimicrobiales bacterium]|nr:M23 family metallopeptidase [Longimicrobiales bacterium]